MMWEYEPDPEDYVELAPKYRVYWVSRHDPSGRKRRGEDVSVQLLIELGREALAAVMRAEELTITPAKK